MKQPNTKRNDRIGEIFSNPFGSSYTIIDYIDAHNVKIQFDNGYILKKCSYIDCKNGRIRSPFCKTVQGIGYIGIRKDGTIPRKTDYKREYMHWNAMISRCYGKTYKSYEDCTVSEELLSFAYFLDHIHEIDNYEEWVNNPNKKWHLDKDLKFKGNKIYSIKNCTFLTVTDNVKEEWQRNPKTLKVIAINLKTGEKFIFDSMRDASENLKIARSSICEVCKGKRKQAKGYKFEYYEE